MLHYGKILRSKTAHFSQTSLQLQKLHTCKYTWCPCHFGNVSTDERLPHPQGVLTTNLLVVHAISYDWYTEHTASRSVLVHNLRTPLPQCWPSLAIFTLSHSNLKVRQRIMATLLDPLNTKSWGRAIWGNSASPNVAPLGMYGAVTAVEVTKLSLLQQWACYTEHTHNTFKLTSTKGESIPPHLEATETAPRPTFLQKAIVSRRPVELTERTSSLSWAEPQQRVLPDIYRPTQLCCNTTSSKQRRILSVWSFSD